MREVENFLEEIAVMKKVSSGECCHVVQMVGCVSTALPLALALEFVPFGDLLSYLRYWRQKVRKQSALLRVSFAVFGLFTLQIHTILSTWQ